LKTFFLVALISLSGCSQPAGKRPDPRLLVTSAAPPNTPAPISNVAMSTLRERAIQIVEEVSQDSDASLRSNAVEAATYAPGRLQDVIQRGLGDKNAGVRGVTATAIGRSRIKGYTPQLQALLTDAEAITRVSAMFALLRTGVEIDRTPFAAYLLENPSPWVKRQVVDVLGLLGDPSAKGLLRAAAKERLPEFSPSQTRLLQLQIAQALVRLGDFTQRPVIRAALYPAQPDELEAAVLAIQIIGETQDKEAAAQLVNIAQYKERSGQKYPPEVRLAVASSLAQLGMPQGSFVANEYVNEPSPTVRAQAAFVYGVTKGAGNGARLVAMMEAPEPLVRISAAAAVLKSLAKQ